jgi:2-dehydro-3-deoxygluconokinase
MAEPSVYDILKDDLSALDGPGPAFVTFGEVMVRDTSADRQRPERTRQVYISMAGSEYTLAIAVARLGIPVAYITRVPDNPYGRAVQYGAREHGINTDYIVWAPKAEPIGRLIYEMGRTPRKSIGYYQRMYSAASRLDRGMVDWASVLRDSHLLHTSGITFGLAAHSKYEHNYNQEAFREAVELKPEGCRVGLDFNYRGSLWSPEQARVTMTPVLKEHVDVLITTIEDMAKIYGLACGQYSAEQIVEGDFGQIEDEDIRSFSERVMREFNLEIVAITIRYPDSFERHRWESAAVNRRGFFYRSPEIRPITLLDRLGGGDTWNGGFYYGLITGSFSDDGLQKGVLVGDAFTRLKQTLMFDLPIVEKKEIQDLMKEDFWGGGKRTVR